MAMTKKPREFTPTEQSDLVTCLKKRVLTESSFSAGEAAEAQAMHGAQLASEELQKISQPLRVLAQDLGRSGPLGAWRGLQPGHLAGVAGEVGVHGA